MATINQVKAYWQKHPLCSYELSKPGEKDFFDNLDRLKREDAERFSLDYWEFDRFQNKPVLDVGCGPGWLTVNYASNGAKVWAMDLTLRAASLTHAFLAQKGLWAQVIEGNAEKLPFKDNAFDLVVSSGVLHHTPDFSGAIKELHRVLKPGGQAKITLYHKGILHAPLVFLMVRCLMLLFKIRHPGSNLAKEAKNSDDFIRRYDGAKNPVGIGKSRREWGGILKQAGFAVKDSRLHFFPKRFIPFKKMIPDFAHYILDRCLGTMVYFDLHKPA